MGIWKTLRDKISSFSTSGINRSYSAYLKSRDWQIIVDATKKIKGDFCCHCYSHDNLHVHHKWYKAGYWKNWGNEETGQLIVLCENCHQGIHDQMDYSEIKPTYDELVNKLQIYCRVCDNPIFDFFDDESFLSAFDDYNTPVYCDYHFAQLDKTD